MSAIYPPSVLTFEASGAIAKGKAVKLVTNNKTVAQCSATTDNAIGIAQVAAVNAGDLVEVALPGGGGKALAKATIALGDMLGINADGSIQKVAGASDHIVAQAMDSAVAGDIFAVHVLSSQAVAAQA